MKGEVTYGIRLMEIIGIVPTLEEINKNEPLISFCYANNYSYNGAVQYIRKALQPESFG